MTPSSSCIIEKVPFSRGVARDISAAAIDDGSPKLLIFRIPSKQPSSVDFTTWALNTSNFTINTIQGARKAHIEIRPSSATLSVSYEN